MSVQLRAVDRTRISGSIVARVQEAIRDGEIDPGSPLPSERVLSDHLGVSRSSVREAIRILEHAGVVEVRSGSGTFVTPDALSRATTMRAQAALVGEQSPLDVMVARRALEPVCAQHAALHRRSHDLQLLRDRLARHASRANGSMEEVAEANLAFHLSLTTATHNPVLVMLAERLIEVMQDSVWHVMKLRPSEERTNVTESFVQEHAAILEAVEGSDGEAAFRAMNAHLDSVETTLFSSSRGPSPRVQESAGQRDWSSG